MKKILILGLLLIWPSFAFAGISTKTMNAVVESWKGYTLNEVIENWGYPTNNKIMAGKNLYYWERNYGTSTNYNYHNGFDSSNKYCNVTFEVNKKNIIIGGQWNGTDGICPYTHKQTKGKRIFGINPNNDLIQKKKDFEKEQKRIKKEEKLRQKELKKNKKL